MAHKKVETKTKKVEFKRVSSPKATKTSHYAFLTIEITLDGEPDQDWIECFKNPATFIPDEAHPFNASVIGNRITFTSFRTNVRTNVVWMDKYIQQANECYKTMDAMYTAEEKNRQKREQAEQEELDKINEMLKDL
ncbi:MAG: hypothetical protein ABSF44_07455 [Candidatus Bathyarchaeia archaeon]|jgi:hypothetical protein